jgi:uncharacterized coiled-coil protein SlyX
VEFSEPSAIGVAFLAVALVYVITREVIVPKIKGDAAKQSPHDHPFYCQAGKFESRISKLETRCTANDANVERLEKKIDHNIEVTSKVQADVSAIREAVVWIKADRENGGS